MTPTQSTSAGTGRPQRYFKGYKYLFFSLGALCIMMVVKGISTSALPHFHKLLIALSLSDCLSEGELSWPVMLQPGGAACSAFLQPRSHTPQSQKQLHITAQRCSSTHQVSFCRWVSLLSVKQQHEHSGEKACFHFCYSPVWMWNVFLWFCLSSSWNKEDKA